MHLEDSVRHFPKASYDWRTDGDFAIKVAVRGVNVHEPGTRGFDGFQRIAQPGKVPREQRRRDQSHGRARNTTALRR